MAGIIQSRSSELQENLSLRRVSRHDLFSMDSDPTPGVVCPPQHLFRAQPERIPALPLVLRWSNTLNFDAMKLLRHRHILSHERPERWTSTL